MSQDVVESSLNHLLFRIIAQFSLVTKTIKVRIQVMNMVCLKNIFYVLAVNVDFGNQFCYAGQT